MPVSGTIIDTSLPEFSDFPEIMNGEVYISGTPSTGIQTKPNYTLSELKTIKRNEIKNTTQQAIIGGMQSSVLGSVHTYPTSETDQQNLTGLVLEANIDGTGGKFWCADSNGIWARRVHTAPQIIQLGREVAAHVKAQQDKYELLLQQIEAAQTIQDLENITW